MTTVLSVESISKQFPLHHNHPVTLKEAAIRWLTGQYEATTVHWALRDVSFSVEQGRSFGIIGHNGAGKSTLLRLLCGLGRPTTGHIRRLGHTSGLLDLGSGFHPDMSGRENILTGGLLSGLSRREVLEQQEEIIAFAELEEFIDEPVRTYSSGMYLRLAFATAMQFDPDILVVDEVLAVGDARFQQKCLERLAAFRAAGKTLIVTSHALDQIRMLCDEVLVLDEGQVILQSDPERALDCYTDLMRRRTERRAKHLSGAEVQPSLTTIDGVREGTQEATISAVTLYDPQGQRITSVPTGESLIVELKYSRSETVADMALILGIYNELQVKCFETSIASISASFGPLSNHGVLRCHLETLPLVSGRYYIDIGLYPADWNYLYDYHWQMHPVWIVSEDRVPVNISGVVALRSTWSAALDPNIAVVQEPA